MTTSRTTIALTTVALVVVGLAACSSGSDDAPGHDHSAHEGAADTSPAADGHEGHDHGAHDSAMDGHDAGGMALKKIEPSAEYPLTTCVVSGEPLGGMGFKESPAAFVEKVPAAAGR
jgi:hypothetical protein